jgi:hypothetical protein
VQDWLEDRVREDPANAEGGLRVVVADDADNSMEAIVTAQVQEVAEEE